MGVLTLKQWGLQDELQDVVNNAENWFRMGSAIPENPDVVILAQLHALIGTREQAEIAAGRHHSRFFQARTTANSRRINR